MKILLSQAALCYYLMGIFSGYFQVVFQHIPLTSIKARSYVLSYYAACFAGIIFLVTTSVKTNWWAFAAIFMVNLLVYVLVDYSITRISAQPAKIKAEIGYYGRYLLPLLVAAMFYFSFAF